MGRTVIYMDPDESGSARRWSRAFDGYALLMVTRF